MSESVAAAASSTFMPLSESLLSARVAAGGVSEEPKLSFEDMPALAKIREEQRTDKKGTAEPSVSECSCPGVSNPAGPAGAEKGAGNASSEGTVRPRGEDGGHVAVQQTQKTGRQAKTDGASPKANGEVEAVAVVKGIHHTATAVAPEQAVVPTQAVPGQAQKVHQQQAFVRNGFMQRAAGPARTAAAPDDKDGVGAVRRVGVQDGKAVGGMAKEGGLAAAGKVSEQTREATVSQAKTVAVKEKSSEAERLEGKALDRRAAGAAPAIEARGAARPQPSPTDKQPDKNLSRTAVEPGPTAQTEEKADRNAGPLRSESHHPRFREAVATDSGKEGRAVVAQAPSKEGSFSDSKEGLKEQADGSMPSGNGPAAFSQRISVQTPGTSGFEGATPKSGSQSVSDQILDSVRASLAGGEKQVMVRLNPPELGAVTVRFQEQGDQIRAVLEVSRNETRQEVERAIPEVLRTLQESGVQIRRVEVILSDQSGKDLGKDQLQQDAWAQQQTSQQHAGNPQAPFATGWSSQTRATRSSAEPDGTGSQGVTSTSGINLLI